MHRDICKAQKLSFKLWYGQKMFGKKTKDIPMNSANLKMTIFVHFFA